MCSDGTCNGTDTARTARLASSSPTDGRSLSPAPQARSRPRGSREPTRGPPPRKSLHGCSAGRPHAPRRPSETLNARFPFTHGPRITRREATGCKLRQSRDHNHICRMFGCAWREKADVVERTLRNRSGRPTQPQQAGESWRTRPATIPRGVAQAAGAFGHQPAAPFNRAQHLSSTHST